MFQKIDGVIVKILKKISIISGLLMAIIAVLATANVLTSKILTWSIPSVNDWITYLFVGVVYCSIAYCRLGDGLISVDILSAHYPKIVKNIFSMICDLIGGFIFVMIVKCSIPLFKNNFDLNVMSSTGKGSFPLWPFNLAIVVFSAIMALAMAWGIVRTIAGMMGKYEEPARTVPTEEAGEGGTPS